jgi:hypothetical protein
MIVGPGLEDGDPWEQPIVAASRASRGRNLCHFQSRGAKLFGGDAVVAAAIFDRLLDGER